MDSPRHLLSRSETIISKADAVAQAKQGETVQDRNLISGVFERLSSACPAWKQSLAGLPVNEAQAVLNQAKRDWLNAFMENGINEMRLIDYAFSKLLADQNPFMPTVGQFIAWCREGNVPEGTRTAHQAYKEVSEYQCLPREKRQPYGLSPEVWHTLANIQDIHSWRHMEKKKHKEYWDAEYERTLETLRDGGPLHEAPPPRQAIENNRTPLNKQKAVSQLQKMRESLK